MIKNLIKGEKKAEYIELIYDLIFVYIIGRNNSLLHTMENGFITAQTYLTYLLTTLIVLQIWYFTTLFINRYGVHGPLEYIGLFVNMYLMYYMADATHASWQDQYTQYNVAWALILLNLAVQYYLKFRRCPSEEPILRRQILFRIALLIGEAAIVLASIPLFYQTGLALSPVAMAAGVVAVLFFGRGAGHCVPVDFHHLTERVMLYVVFTFGEMIIAIASYFEGGIKARSVYFSLMAFLIVAGLFLIYGYCYDSLIDRKRITDGTSYMMLHIFLVTMLNNLTAALEFMREDEVDAVKKNAFLTVSFILYFVFLFLLLIHAKADRKPNKRFFILTGGLTLLFSVMMAAFYTVSMVSIAATVVYIYGMFGACVWTLKPKSQV